MDFPLRFRTWLDSVAPQLTPGVEAFSFNLFQPSFVPGVKFGIELIGAGTFSTEDQDWPCDEIWEQLQEA